MDHDSRSVTVRETVSVCSIRDALGAAVVHSPGLGPSFPLLILSVFPPTVKQPGMIELGGPSVNALFS
jgi:hypothetical protein